MDETAIASEFVTTAAPVMGEIVAAVRDNVVEATSDEVAAEAVRGVKAGGAAVWRRMLGRASEALPEGDRPLAAAGATVAENPDDADALHDLREQVRRLLATDQELQALVAEWASSGQEMPSRRSVHSRDISQSTIVTGDNNRIG